MGERLAGLVNCLQFLKLKPSKSVLTINSLLAYLFARCLKRVNLSNFYPSKLSHSTASLYRQVGLSSVQETFT